MMHLDDVSIEQLKQWLAGSDEFALIDVGEEGEFGLGHLLRAINVPYSRLELLVPPLVPRRTCPVLLIDHGNGIASRARERLHALGYTQVGVVRGGVPAWRMAGNEVFQGIYVPSKAFGEWVEHTFGTPSIDAGQLAELLDANAEVIVLDPRTEAEHAARHVPSAVSCPGGELVYRFDDLVSSPDTLVVVACGGRTRGIVGAQTLINSGVPNRVVALADGNHGWRLAGFELEVGMHRRFPSVSAAGGARAAERAAGVARRFGIARIDRSTFDDWMSEAQQARRTTYAFDVRTPQEFACGHLPGTRSAPGGQLIQATDQWVGTLNARVVLIDSDNARATMTAHWLKHMGWDVYVLTDAFGIDAPSSDAAQVNGYAVGADAADRAARVEREWSAGVRGACEIAPADAMERIRSGALAVSFDSSADYLAAHPPGAVWANRARLEKIKAHVRDGRSLVLFSSDAATAHLAALDLAEIAGEDVAIAVVAGGLRAWREQGLPIEASPESALSQDARVDVLYWANDRRQGNADAMRAYLDWEKHLLAQVAADGHSFGLGGRSIDAPTLKRWLHDGDEIALFDVREHGQYGEGHPLFAVSLPYSRLEIDAERLAPRKDVRVVVFDGGSESSDDGAPPVAARASQRLAALGYTKVHVLNDGMHAWRDAGLNVFSGVNVPSKVFGELIEHAYDTPRVGADELVAWRASGRNVLLLDGRPIDEHRKMSVPGSICVPNGELALRVDDLPGSNEAILVVHCAGRTRSIVGAQTLINLGWPKDRVLALENGTQGWYLADHALEHGDERRYSDTVSPAALAAAQVASAALAERFGVPSVDADAVVRWQAEGEHSVFLFDVRTGDEFAAGSLSGARHVPGGQLVHATDRYVGVRHAKVIVFDDDGVRAPVIASWLRQLGHDAYVLTAGLRSGLTLPRPDGWRAQALPGIDARELSARRYDAKVCVIDVRSSMAFRRAHMAGAIWSIRPRLATVALPSDRSDVVLVADDDAVAALAAAELLARRDVSSVSVLTGGFAAWAAAGLPCESSPDQPSDQACIDFLFFVHDRHEGNREAARRYLEWETGLIAQLDSDELAEFDMRGGR